MPEKQSYRVRGVDRDGVHDDRCVLVRASGETAAGCVGRYWLRVIHGRRFRRVSVSEYHPECDRVLSRFMRPVAEEAV
jgi:hypothetical protein